MRSYWNTILGASLAATARAAVPSDLTSGFSDSLGLQASFINKPSEGFSDGATLPQQQTQNEPRFALDDSAGINSQLRFLMMMIDTSCGENQRTLKFAQRGFFTSGLKTQVESKTAPDLAYQPPGSQGETGARQYAFLMYIQDNADQALQGLPGTGQPFDVAAFQKANGLDDPENGVSFNADLGGTLSCGNEGGQTSPPTYTSTFVPPPVYTSTYVPPPAYTSTFVPPPAYTSTYVPPYTSTYVPPAYTSTYVPPVYTSAPPPPPPGGNGTYTPPSNGTIPGTPPPSTITTSTTGAPAPPGSATSSVPQGAAATLGLDASKYALVGMAGFLPLLAL